MLVHERREEQRGIGDAAGDHDVGALRERVDDRPRAEVRGREQRLAGEVGERLAGVEVRERLTRVGVQLRRGGSSTSSPTTVAIVIPLTPSFCAVSIAALCGRGRIDAAGVGDHLGAAVATNGSARARYAGRSRV